MNAVEFRQVWEKYRIKFIIDRKVSWEEIWALADVSLEVGRGEILGIVGQNGAGKTTFLRLVAGMLLPDKGDVKVSGRVSSLMELGAGFNPEFTGRENVVLNARTYGIDGKVLDEQVAKIIEFAGLGKFIDAPVKYYSQGMYMRLGFSLAVFVDPDVLLIDDILSVGDEEAQHKCIEKILELKGQGKTMIIVSHDMHMIERLCDRAVLLEHGRVVACGLPADVISCYLGTASVEPEPVQEDGAERISRHTLEAGALRLFIDDKDKVIRFYDKDKEITGGKGFYSVIGALEKSFEPKDARWEVQKLSEKELALSMEFPDPLFRQALYFSSSGDGAIDIKMEMKTDAPLALVYQDVRLELADLYQTWATAFEEGSFDVWQGFDHVYPIRWKNNKIPGVVLKAKDGGGRLDVSFVSFADTGSRIMSLNKRKESGSDYISLNSSGIVSKTRELLEPGNRLFFEGRLSLGRDLQPQHYTGEEAVDLKAGSLRFVFDSGRGMIFMAGKELTSGMSLYTSVRAGNIWLDSCQALWEIELKKDKKIVAVGHWPHLPLSQKWSIEMGGENSILLGVETRIHGEVHLEIEQVSLMLPSVFKAWSTSEGQRGSFAEEFTTDYDILPYRFWYGDAEHIEASGDGFPKMILKRGPAHRFLRGVVENTDSLYKARLVQYQKTNPRKEPPGAYSLFQGAIEIGA
ncbi:MAG TPA: hypothetical protein DCL35_01860 [Candidatus Omnitrophica bacterium]|nr:hypothetical protein [Candidatus Omnitrophota bacterium]